MKYTDIKGQALAELKKKKRSLKGELAVAKMKNSLGQLGNPLEIRKLRRNVARINTALTQKEQQG